MTTQHRDGLTTDPPTIDAADELQKAGLLYKQYLELNRLSSLAVLASQPTTWVHNQNTPLGIVLTPTR